MSDLVMRLNRLQHSDPRTSEIGRAGAARILELEAENKKLKEALKPFKTRLEDRSKFEEATYGSSYRAGDSFEIYVPIGDLRRAVAALGEKP